MGDDERDGQVRQRRARVRGDLDQLLNDLQLARVGRQRRVETARDALRTAGRQGDVAFLPVLAAQPSARQRAPGDHAHAVPGAGRQDRRLGTTGEDRIRRLLAAEPLVPAAFGDPLALDDLLGREGRRADRAYLPGPDQVGQGRQRLVDIGGRIGTVHLVQVDVVGLHAPQAVIHFPDDPAAGVAARMGVVAHAPVGLGGQDHRVAASPQGVADDLLGFALGVHVRGVDEVDPGVQGGVDDPRAVVMVGIAPRPEHHRPQAVGADLDSRSAECAHPHQQPSPSW